MNVTPPVPLIAVCLLRSMSICKLGASSVYCAHPSVCFSLRQSESLMIVAVLSTEMTISLSNDPMFILLPAPMRWSASWNRVSFRRTLLPHRFAQAIGISAFSIFLGLERANFAWGSGRPSPLSTFHQFPSNGLPTPFFPASTRTYTLSPHSRALDKLDFFLNAVSYGRHPFNSLGDGPITS